MEIIKTLYKKDSKGKIRVLHISTLQGKLIQESGLIGGKFTQHSSLSKAKNIGRSNETTPQEQAILEAEAKIKKKLEEGYFESTQEARDIEVVLPMLAKSFKPEAKKIDWGDAYVQPKLDGIRCLKKDGKMISRKNKSIDTLPHINEEYTFIEDWLDGELYAHGLSFQENMKIIKKNRPESIDVKYHVYDMVIPRLSFSKRYRILSAIMAERYNHMELVPAYKVESLEEVQKYHSQFIDEGYEGTMVRWGSDGYKIDARSSNLLKYKDFIDEVYKVIDVLPSDKNPEQGVIQCEIILEDGTKSSFGCGMKFSHEDRVEILTNKEDYIGQTAEVRFFEYTDGGIPRFPVCVGFRLDK
jgi:DNA ligase-1